jgi:hypothetical protein
MHFTVRTCRNDTTGAFADRYRPTHMLGVADMGHWVDTPVHVDTSCHLLLSFAAGRATPTDAERVVRFLTSVPRTGRLLVHSPADGRAHAMAAAAEFATGREPNAAWLAVADLSFLKSLDTAYRTGGLLAAKARSAREGQQSRKAA